MKYGKNIPIQDIIWSDIIFFYAKTDNYVYNW